MKRTAIIVSVILLALEIQAQILTPSVVGSGGDFFSASQGSLAWTIGEPMIETYSSSSGFFTQGFHQPLSILVTGVIEPRAIPQPMEIRCGLLQIHGDSQTLRQLHSHAVTGSQ